MVRVSVIYHFVVWFLLTALSSIKVVESESESSHGSLASSSVVMPGNPTQTIPDPFSDVFSPVTPSAVSTMTDETSSVGSAASFVEPVDSDWDDVVDVPAPGSLTPDERNIQEEYQVVYDSSSERA
jgi:hypothetical protein